MAETEASNSSLLPGGKNRTTGTGNVWAFVKRCKRGVKKWKPWNFSNIRNKDGQIGNGPDDNAANFQAYYVDLFRNDPSPTRPDESARWYCTMPVVPSDREWPPPTMSEMCQALNEIKNTAPGMSGIKISVWQAISKDLKMKQVMLDIMIGCWNSNEVPTDWTAFYMTVLEKKGDKSMPKNYRGISIAETISKVYTTILKYRLSALYEDLAPEYANGFRKGRSRADSITSVLGNSSSKEGVWS